MPRRFLFLVAISSAALGCDAGRSSEPGAATGGSSGGTSSSAGGTSAQGGSGAPAAGAEPCGAECASLAERDPAELFDRDTVPKFDFTLAPERWEWLKSHVLDEEYVEAGVRFDGVPLGTVGLRFKGSYGTLVACVDDTGALSCPKLSMKVRFDEYVPEQRFFGLKRLNFHSMVYDQTALHERIGYDMYRELRVQAPRSFWAELSVNGEAFGLFSLVEQIDGRFTDSRWPDGGDGNLYKEAWPLTTDVAYFEERFESGEQAPTHEAFAAFSTALAEASDEELPSALAGFTDLGYLYRYLAVDDALVNWDGITAIYCDPMGEWCGNHNFYFYQEVARPFFWLVPWDLDSTLDPSSPFAQVPRWDRAVEDCSVRYGVFDLDAMPPACDPVFRALAADPTAYQAAARELLAGPLDERALLDKIDYFAALLEPVVSRDPIGPGLAGWQAAVARLRANLPLLRQRVEAFVAGESVASVALGLDRLNDFEGLGELGVASGAISLANPSSTIAHSLNLTDALEGNQDLRLDFEYRDELEIPWGQWTYFDIPLEGGVQDLGEHTTLRLLARTDKPRTLRIDLESPNYLASDEGIKFGWDVAVGPETTMLELSIDSATLPSWAEPTGDDFALVRASLAGLAFQPMCEGRDSFGFLLPGTTDVGFLQVDAIEIE